MLMVAWMIATIGKLFWDVHYFDGYDPSAPFNLVVRGEDSQKGMHWTEFTFDGLPGIPVPAVLGIPETAPAGPLPVVLFLHGMGQDRGFVREIAEHFSREGFAIASFDQYLQGDREVRGMAFLDQGLGLRRRGALTINESRRLIDYLVTRPDIDPGRIYLAGASYGAITGSTVAAFDKRIQAVVLTYGGGDLTKLAANAEVVEAVGPMVGLVGTIAAWFGAPFDPVRYVAGISPRPVLFQNGNRDRIVIPEAAIALYNAAAEPKEIKWYESDHLDLSPEFIPVALKDAMTWLKVQDAKIMAARTRS